MKVFGIDPGSARTGYGCVQSDGTRHRLIACGAIAIPASKSFPEKLRIIHVELGTLIARHQPTASRSRICFMPSTREPRSSWDTRAASRCSLRWKPACRFSSTRLPR